MSAMHGEATVQAAWSDEWRVQDGYSCLGVACKKGHIEVVKYLVKAGGKELLMSRDSVSAWAGPAEYAISFVRHVHEAMYLHPRTCIICLCVYACTMALVLTLKHPSTWA